MSSVSFHRSAIYAYYIHVGNTPVEQHPWVCTLMTGIFKNRPLKQRKTFLWDIETVLNHLTELPDNSSLPKRTLSHIWLLKCCKNRNF